MLEIITSKGVDLQRCTTLLANGAAAATDTSLMDLYEEMNEK